VTVFILDQAQRGSQRRLPGLLLRPVQAPHPCSQDRLPPVAIGLCKLPKAAIARSAQALSLSPMVVLHIRAAAYVIQSWPWPIGRLTRCSV